jgi:hypothetical protein
LNLPSPFGPVSGDFTSPSPITVEVLCSIAPRDALRQPDPFLRHAALLPNQGIIARISKSATSTAPSTPSSTPDIPSYPMAKTGKVTVTAAEEV